MLISNFLGRLARRLGVALRPARVFAGAVILAGGLSFVGGADAQELIVNGSFENNNGFDGNNSGFGWSHASGDPNVFDVYNYTQLFGGALPYAGSKPASGGDWYFHTVGIAEGNFVDPVFQTVDLTAAAPPAAIDAGSANYTFSGYLAGFIPQNDHAEVQLTFFDGPNGTGNQVGNQVVFDGDQFGPGSNFVDTVDGDAPAIANWKRYASVDTLPVGARSAAVEIFKATQNGNGNDNYVDLISLNVGAVGIEVGGNNNIGTDPVGTIQQNSTIGDPTVLDDNRVLFELRAKDGGNQGAAERFTIGDPSTDSNVLIDTTTRLGNINGGPDVYGEGWTTGPEPAGTRGHVNGGTAGSSQMDNIVANYTFQVYDEDGVFGFTENVDDRVNITVNGNNFHTDTVWNARTNPIWDDEDGQGGGWYTVEVHLAEDGGGAGEASAPGFGFNNNPQDPDFTDVPPNGWTKDNGSTPNDPDRPEYQGWTFLNKDFWITQQGNQERSLWTNGSGTVAVADPDGHDDFAGNEPDQFNSFLTTEAVSFTGLDPNSITLEFDSSFRPFDGQTATVDVSFDGGLTFENVLTYDTANSGGNSSLLRIDEQLSLGLDNPADGELLVRYGLTNAGNDWWWAFDNLNITGNNGAMTLLSEDFEGLALKDSDLVMPAFIIDGENWQGDVDPITGVGLRAVLPGQLEGADLVGVLQNSVPWVFELDGDVDMLELINTDPSLLTTVMDLNDADLIIEALNLPTPGEYQLLKADEFIGAFGSLTIDGAANRLDTSRLASEGILVVLPQGTGPVIPEPATWVILVGLSGCSLLRRRSRS